MTVPGNSREEEAKKEQHGPSTTHTTTATATTNIQAGKDEDDNGTSCAALKDAATTATAAAAAAADDDGGGNDGNSTGNPAPNDIPNNNSLLLAPFASASGRSIVTATGPTPGILHRTSLKDTNTNTRNENDSATATGSSMAMPTRRSLRNARDGGAPSSPPKQNLDSLEDAKPAAASVSSSAAEHKGTAHRTSPQQQQQQEDEEAGIPLPARRETNSNAAKKTQLSPNGDAVLQIADTASEEFIAIDSTTSMNRGSILAPESREASLPHNLKQSDSNGADASTQEAPPPTALVDQDTNHQQSAIPNASADSDRDHLAAISIARQDLAAKTDTATNPTSPSSERNRPATAIVATSTSAATTSTVTASSTRRSNIPVGAFRIQPSHSGQYDITAPSAVSDGISNDNDNILQPQLQTVESSLVVESILVEEDDSNGDDGTGRRRRRRRRAASTDSADNESGVDIPNDNAAGVASSGGSGDEPNENHQNRNDSDGNDEDNPGAPKGTRMASAALAAEASPPMIDDSAVVVVTAETPTLNDSIWTLLKSRKGRLGVLILIAIVATLTVLGVTVFKNNAPAGDNSNTKPTQQAISMAPTVPLSMDPTNEPTLTPATVMPTAAPTIRRFTQSDLPLGTIAAIENDSSSPQARAWRWLQQDIQIRFPNGETPSSNITYPSLIPQYQQIIQRFALATLYFSTNGAGWQSQRFWLSPSGSECDWWPHVQSASWPYRQGPVVCNVGTGAYTKLLLNNNLLQGEFPNELSLLSDLELIDVSSNPQLTGAIPQTLCETLSSEGSPEVKITCNVGLSCDCCQCA